jgi:hypothetical protein
VTTPNTHTPTHTPQGGSQNFSCTTTRRRNSRNTHTHTHTHTYIHVCECGVSGRTGCGKRRFISSCSIGGSAMRTKELAAIASPPISRQYPWCRFLGPDELSEFQTISRTHTHTHSRTRVYSDATQYDQTDHDTTASPSPRRNPTTSPSAPHQPTTHLVHNP